MGSFNAKIDADADATLAPILIDEEDKMMTRPSDGMLEPRRYRASRRQQPGRGFAWQDPTRKRLAQKRKPPQTVAEKIDEAANTAIEPAEMRPLASKLQPREQQRPSTSRRTGPERAAAWLVRKFEESNLVDDENQGKTRE
jgi:hypothetical protein